jgi:hypothetical protein
MKILKYIAIDFLSILSIYILNIVVYPNFGRASSYIEIVVVCFFVGLFFSHGVAHGVSISIEDIFLHMTILFMIGRPLSSPVSDILNIGIIGPLLTLIPTGLIAGFVGGQIKKYTKKQR